MIFWWSETRLAKFIENCLSEIRIPNKVNSIENDLEMLNSAIEQDRNSIGNIEKYLKKYSQEISDSFVSINKIIDEIKKENTSNYQNVLIDTDELKKLVYSQISALSNEVNGNLNVLEQKIAKLESIEEGKQSSIDIEALVNSIRTEYINVIAKNIAENNSAVELRFQEASSSISRINEVVSRHESGIKQLMASKSNSESELYAQLVKDFKEEQEKNKFLTELVNKQSEGITALTQKVEQLTKDIEKLNRGTEKQQKKISLFFDEDNNSNICKILMLIDRANVLKQELLDRGMSEDDVYMKLVDNLLDKLIKLSTKNSEKSYGSDKLANEIVKILKQTIVKGMNQERIKDVFTKYMETCGIRKLDWSIGKKMTNDDYEYLEEPIMYEEVQEYNKVGTIVGILQDTYVIDYIEDTEKYEAIIPGIYRIGKAIK